MNLIWVPSFTVNVSEFKGGIKFLTNYIKINVKELFLPSTMTVSLKESRKSGFASLTFSSRLSFFFKSSFILTTKSWNCMRNSSHNSAALEAFEGWSNNDSRIIWLYCFSNSSRTLNESLEATFRNASEKDWIKLFCYCGWINIGAMNRVLHSFYFYFIECKYGWHGLILKCKQCFFYGFNSSLLWFAVKGLLTCNSRMIKHWESLRSRHQD